MNIHTRTHLPGLNHEKLTYRNYGHDFRLTAVYAVVVKQLIT